MKLKNKVRSLITKLTLVVSMMAMSVTAFADNEGGGALNNSTLVTGTQKLIADVQTWLLVLAPVVGGVFIVYFSIRRSGADEQDQKRWKAFVTTIVQIMLCKIGLKLMMNTHILTGYNIFWGIACMISAISIPKILREFLVPTGGDGHFGTTVYQTVRVASMAKSAMK